MSNKTLPNILKDVLKEPYFHGPGAAIPVVKKMRKSSPLFLVLGENGAGKSFLRRLLTTACMAEGIDVFHFSQEGRATPGMANLCLYGAEERQATGEITCHTVTLAIRACQEHQLDHVVFWDEPDTGLSDNAVAGVGLEIEHFIQNLPARTLGVFVTTHSRELVRRLAGTSPSYLHLGTRPKNAPKSIGAWLKRPVLPVFPDEVQEQSLERFRQIQAIQDSGWK